MSWWWHCSIILTLLFIDVSDQRKQVLENIGQSIMDGALLFIVRQAGGPQPQQKINISVIFYV